MIAEQNTRTNSLIKATRDAAIELEVAREEVVESVVEVAREVVVESEVEVAEEEVVESVIERGEVWGGIKGLRMS